MNLKTGKLKNCQFLNGKKVCKKMDGKDAVQQFNDRKREAQWTKEAEQTEREMDARLEQDVAKINADALNQVALEQQQAVIKGPDTAAVIPPVNSPCKGKSGQAAYVCAASEIRKRGLQPKFRGFDCAGKAFKLSAVSPELANEIGIDLPYGGNSKRPECAKR